MRPSLLLIAAALTLAPAASPVCAASADVEILRKVFAGHQACVVLKDLRRGRVLRWNSERCDQRFTPCSTFKIPNALIALETGVAPNQDFLQKWDGAKQPFSGWERDHTLKSAFSASCLWYYQGIAKRIGAERMKSHVNALEYGNQDLSGGLTRFWLGSSLAISASEQADFVTRLVKNELPVSKRAADIVKEIMVVSRRGDEVFRGKTGTDGDPVKKIATLGWYVGYHTRGKDIHVFAVNISGGENPSGRKAKKLVEQMLTQLGHMSPQP